MIILHSDESENGEDLCKAKTKPVIPLFNRLENGKFQCKKCLEQNVPNDRNMIASSKSSDANLRKHMYTRHEISDFLFPSQKIQIGLEKDETCTMSAEQKQEIDEAIMNATIIDGRSFMDFSKPGKKNKKL